MAHPLDRKIAEGEHLEQDFKFRIDDSRKIAKTLSAFANTRGGRLLIGVKDNGRVAGVQPEEEFYMIQAAAEMYNRPSVKFHSFVWDYEGKSVLEITIPPSSFRPHQAEAEPAQWKAYIRFGDTNYAASPVHIAIWKHASPLAGKGKNRSFTQTEQAIIQILKATPDQTLNQLHRKAGTRRGDTIEALATLMDWEIVACRPYGEKYLFCLELSAEETS